MSDERRKAAAILLKEFDRRHGRPEIEPLTPEELAILEFWFTGPRITDPFSKLGYTHRMDTFVNPSNEEIQQITLMAMIHPRIRITVERWEQRQ